MFEVFWRSLYSPIGEMPLTFVFVDWGFGVGESICCIEVLGGGFLSFEFYPEITMIKSNLTQAL